LVQLLWKTAWSLLDKLKIVLPIWSRNTTPKGM
jgi:hypothetical protein